MESALGRFDRRLQLHHLPLDLKLWLVHSHLNTHNHPVKSEEPVSFTEKPHDLFDRSFRIPCLNPERIRGRRR